MQGAEPPDEIDTYEEDNMKRTLMAAVAVGGLMLSQILTLYITPVIYIYLDRVESRWREWRARVRARKHGGAQGAPAD